MGLNLVALRKAKIVYNFGLSECSRVKYHTMSLVIKDGVMPLFWHLLHVCICTKIVTFGQVQSNGRQVSNCFQRFS